MSALIFDIETVGEEWSELDVVTQSVLTRWLEKAARTKLEKEALLADVQANLGFSPFTGFVVAIGVYDITRARGVVYYSGEGALPDQEWGDYVYKERSEREMLAEFWEGVQHYDTFVTFNGRAFDVPFLIHRSLAYRISPTKNLLEGRYPYQQKACRHVDLQDEFSFYGALARRPSLHLLCRAYGVESSKGEVSGDDVAKLFRQKKFLDIARYNAADVRATTELYQIWQRFLQYDSNPPDIAF